MVDYTKLEDVKRLLAESQDADSDNRDKVRRVTHFLHKPDGQWEPSVVNNMAGRPRYTFDMCNPIVDQIASEMEQSDFDIRIRPAGGDATKDLAATYDGIIRNIENISGAVDIFNAAGRSMIEAGYDGWRVVQDWASDGSFEQDLIIKPIANFVDRVWFDPSSELQDRSDSRYCFVLQVLSKNEYDERWPEGSGRSVSDGNSYNVYQNKAEQIAVGEFLYRKEVSVGLVQMSNGAVYEVDDKFNSIADELAAEGITEERHRKKTKHVVYSRLFDGDDWLTKEQETVFSYIPVIPTYGNFKISENKLIYRGAVEKLMDGQMVYNYAKSRQIEEGALSPRPKYWGIPEQFQGHEATLQTLNTNANPIQTYNHVDGVPPPFWAGGAQVNPGLQTTADDAARSVIVSSGMYSANMADNPGLQSGVAIEKLQNKGDAGTIKYFKSQEIAIRHTAKILVDAIPKVYDTKRQIRILGEDGSFEMVTLNEQIFDDEQGKLVTVNDLSKGVYDVVCDVGEAFQNRQDHTVKAITQIAAIDPSIIGQGADILLNNISAPGIDILAERKRDMMVKQGLIPLTQLTDEEKAMLQQMMMQQAQNQQPSAEDKIADAEIGRVQAETADTLSKIEERQNKMAMDERKLILDAQKQQFDQQNTVNQAILNELKMQAETLKTLREAIGADTIVGDTNMGAYIEQADIVGEAQDVFNSED